MNILTHTRALATLLCLLFGTYAQVAAQNTGPSLRGRVSSSRGEPVAYASISIAGTTTGTVANLEGQYVLALPSRGKYRIQARSLGYETVVAEVDASRDTIRLDLVLPEQELFLPDQIITSSGEDPAYGIIRAAIRRRKINDQSVRAFTVKAYTKIIGIDNESKRKQEKAAKTGKKSDQRKANNAEPTGIGGIVFLSESYSTKYVQKPNKEKEIVHNSRVSGSSSDYSALASLGVVLNPYKNLLEFPKQVFPREFVSPIADNALFFYRYKLIGSYRERGFLVYKIEVLPKRGADPVVAGEIYIVDGSFAVKGLDWSVNKTQPVRYFDSLYFKQDYLPIRDSLWVPFTNYVGAVIKLNLLVEKVDASGSLLNVFSDYNITDPPVGGSARATRAPAAAQQTQSAQAVAKQLQQAEAARKKRAAAEAARKQKEAQEAEALAAQLNQPKAAALSDSTEKELARLAEAERKEEEQRAATEAPITKADSKFWDEIIKVEQNVTAKNKNVAFWDSLRPAVLSKDELREFQRGDSLQFSRDSTKILDSLYKHRHRLATFPELGWRYRNPRTKTSYSVGFNWLGGWNFNTAEGWNLRLDGSASWRVAERKTARLTSAIRYSIANKRFSYRVGGNYPLNTRVQEYFFFEGGYYPKQFSAFDQIEENVNTFYSLLAEQNFMRIYQRAGGSVTYQRRLNKDNILSVTAEAARRQPLVNLSSQVWNPRADREYKPNTPPEPFAVPLRDHEAASISVRYLLRFSSKYITTPDGTFYINNPGWPRLSFEYAAGVQRAATFNSTFHRVGVRLDGTIDAKLLGESTYRVRAVKMWANGALEFPDLIQVRGNQTIFRVDEIDRFGILDYYRYATNDRMIETHFEHNFRGFWLNKIPLIRTLKWHEIAGLHSVAMIGRAPHTELLLGISNIRVLRLDLFRVNYHLVLTGENSLRSGVTFTIGFGL
jgi:hypothetical protein